MWRAPFPQTAHFSVKLMIAMLDRALERVLQGLAALAAILIMLAIVLVVLNVAGRATGIGAFRFTIAVVEYILLYFALLSAPYLLRIRGHVLVDMIIKNLTGLPRVLLESAIYIVGIIVSVIFVVVSLDIMQESIARGTFDERSIDIAYWVLYAPYPLCFGLLAIEFARNLFRFGSLYESNDPQEGL